jgi:hypothetical protein
MRMTNRVLLAAMLLVTTWIALSLTDGHARAEPPSPCFRFAACQ